MNVSKIDMRRVSITHCPFKKYDTVRCVSGYLVYEMIYTPDQFVCECRVNCVSPQTQLRDA